MIIIGVDPGNHGALAFLDPEADELQVFDMPVFTVPKATKGIRTEIDISGLANLIDSPTLYEHDRVFAFVEMARSGPEMGVVSAFNYGAAYMAVRMALACHAIPTALVTPQTWKKALGVAAGRDSVKTDAVRARASALMPQHSRLWPLKKHVAHAEAALIALYGSRLTHIRETDFD